MEKAWGLHKEAQFEDIGSNMFVVRFGSEGYWRHAMHNGPCQFDSSVLVVKEYEGDIRPYEMVFDSVETWFIGMVFVNLPWIPLTNGDHGCEPLRVVALHLLRMKDGSSLGLSNNSNNRGKSWTDDSENEKRGYAYVRDISVKRNLFRDCYPSADSRTSGGVRVEHREVSSPNKHKNRHVDGSVQDLRDNLEQNREFDIRQDLKHR
ncbi:hypothetical protein D1007_51395 [Hordeum vulgare]|nr:hypothetical protein D1007_51395 [Hordeum vulgare]